MKKTIANKATDKGLISKIYKVGHEQPNQKIGRRPKQTLLQIRRTDGQQAHEKMINYQMNAKEKYNDVSLH